MCSSLNMRVLGNGSADPSHTKGTCPDSFDAAMKVPSSVPPDVEVLGPVTSAQIAALIESRRITCSATLERAGVHLVRAWGREWLALPTVARGFKLWGFNRNGRARLDANGKLERRNAGPVSLFVSSDLRKREQQVLRLYDVEGESDALACIDQGMVSVIATTGGAGTLAGHDRHREWLMDHKPEEVAVVRDLDRVGEKGADAAAQWWQRQGIAVRVVRLPSELGEHGDVRDFLLGRAPR